MGDAPEFDDIRVVHINAGNDEGADITIEINSKRITVSLFASPSWQDEGNSQLGTPIEDQLIQLLNQAVTAADEDYDDLINRALDTILDIGGPAFSKVAPPMCDSSQGTSPDLHSHLYPDALDFRLQTIDGKVAIFQINPDEAISLPDAAPNPRFPTVFQPDSPLPFYSSKAIFVEHVFVSGNGTVSQVQVDGQTMLCKARRTGLQDPGLELELMNLQKIWKYNLSSDSTIRVPKLRGYVKHAYSGAIIGLLRDWVPSGSHGNTLRDIDVCAVSPDLRRRWAAQIRQTVSRLHAIGVVWGDGKASNVIVDKYDDVWLIDLGGGWSRGWVDEELADTEEGDDQAVARIVKFLDL
ncbi:Protein kinase-like domain protein, partial [Metarhizium majus ARSEF 297]